MNFFALCYELFINTSQYHDLRKDVDNYNKVIYYLYNFGSVDRKEIEKFIVEVRIDNLVYSAKRQLLKVFSHKPLKTLDQLTPYELYVELQGEITNIILKGAYDSFNILNNLTQEQEKNLAKRIALGDLTIFNEYICR